MSFPCPCRSHLCNQRSLPTCHISGSWTLLDDTWTGNPRPDRVPCFWGDTLHISHCYCIVCSRHVHTLCGIHSKIWLIYLVLLHDLSLQFNHILRFILFQWSRFRIRNIYFPILIFTFIRFFHTNTNVPRTRDLLKNYPSRSHYPSHNCFPHNYYRFTYMDYGITPWMDVYEWLIGCVELIDLGSKNSLYRWFRARLQYLQCASNLLLSHQYNKGLYIYFPYLYIFSLGPNRSHCDTFHMILPAYSLDSWGPCTP